MFYFQEKQTKCHPSLPVPFNIRSLINLRDLFKTRHRLTDLAVKARSHDSCLGNADQYVVPLKLRELDLMSTECDAHSLPRQVFISSEDMKPSKQRHWYIPGVLVHWPPSQMSGLSRHSSMSEDARKT